MPRDHRHGDFLVDPGEREQAQHVFMDRPPEDRKRDKQTREPITTNPDYYEAVNGVSVDFPGVDTPTDEPKRHTMDMMAPQRNDGDDENGVDAVYDLLRL